MIKRLNLKRLQKKFIQLVLEYMAKNDLNITELAKLAGLQRSHISNLLNQSADRPLTAYYIQIFIRKGIFKMADIYDGQPESKRESDFWDQVKETDNWELLDFIAKVRKQKKVDLLAVLKSIYPDVK